MRNKTKKHRKRKGKIAKAMVVVRSLFYAVSVWPPRAKRAGGERVLAGYLGEKRLRLMNYYSNRAAGAVGRCSPRWALRGRMRPEPSPADYNSQRSSRQPTCLPADQWERRGGHRAGSGEPSDVAAVRVGTVSALPRR